MRSFLSQDFVTIRGNSAVTTITQSQHAWLDLANYQSAVAWLQVEEVNNGGGTLNLGYQTAPSVDENLFIPLGGPITPWTFVPSVGLTVTPLVRDLLGAPLARWFRWQLTNSGASSTWDITFRLFLVAHTFK